MTQLQLFDDVKEKLNNYDDNLRNELFEKELNWEYFI